MAEAANLTLIRCLTCQYPLVGLSSHRCPECGRAFDPADPGTYFSGHKPPGPVALFFLKPPGRVFHVLCCVALVLALATNTVPGGYFLGFVFGFYIWAALIITWWIRGIAYSFLCLRYRRDRNEKIDMKWRRWGIAPAILVFCILAIMADVPLWCSFWLSKPAMDRMAAQVIATSTPVLAPQRVGLMVGFDFKPFPGGMRFLVESAGFIDQYGFAYVTSPATVEMREYSHWHGNWYVWRNRF